MLSLNNHLFLLLNASAEASPLLVTAAAVIASKLVYVPPILLVALWVRGEPERRAGLAATGDLL